MRRFKQEMVFDRHLGELRPLWKSPRVSSAGLGWNGFILEHHRLNTFETRDVMWLNNVVILHLGPPADIEVKENGHYVSRRYLPGHVSLRPAEQWSSGRSKDMVEYVSVSLDAPFLATACLDLGLAGGVALKSVDAVKDPFVEGLCRTLMQEAAEGGQNGRLYSETLANSLGVHLAVKYGVKDASYVPSVASISHRAVRRGMEYIQDRLHEDLSLRDISVAVGLSPFHFARMFKSRVGMSPYQFVIRKRVEKAKGMILEGQHALAVIAAECGFADQSHLTLHFKKLCGVTPKAFRDRCRTGNNL